MSLEQEERRTGYGQRPDATGAFTCAYRALVREFTDRGERAGAEGRLAESDALKAVAAFAMLMTEAHALKDR